MKQEPSSELLEYASAYVDQRLNAEQMADLEAILRGDAEARRIFAQFLHDHAALQWHYIDTGTTSKDVLGWLEQDGERQKAQKQGMSKMAWVAMAACLALGLMVSWFIAPGWREDTALRTVQAETTAQAKSLVAHLTRAEGVILRNGAVLDKGDDGLQPGDIIELESGLLELVFQNSDVHVIATPPLKMEVISNMGVKLEQGELQLHVPPQGIGFEVETLERKIIDLGTSFVVSTAAEESRVLVLDGKISVECEQRNEQEIMEKGEVASFRKGSPLEITGRILEDLPDLSAPSPQGVTPVSLKGRFFTFGKDVKLPPRVFPLEDHMGSRFLPLVQSGFSDDSALVDMAEGRALAFEGIAGAYSKLAEQARSEASGRYRSWMVWYQGEVKPPRPGRYRFWGYADNYLLVAINGKPVFNGSRFDTALREQLDSKSKRHPGFPCFNAKAGIASGEWVELGDEPVRIDILFGEMGNRYTSGILQVEREGETHDESYWGQPKWPLFLTHEPDKQRKRELRQLNGYLEDGLKGAFSIPEDDIWRVVE
ncbi:MAG: hypothetical protein ACPIG6_10815 [Akkermansiaceae bacterium]